MRRALAEVFVAYPIARSIALFVANSIRLPSDHEQVTRSEQIRRPTSALLAASRPHCIAAACVPSRFPANERKHVEAITCRVFGESDSTIV